MGRRVALLALLFAACDDAGPGLPTPLINHCMQAFDCSKNEICDPALGICTLMQTSEPYRYALRITPQQLADAGVRASVSTAPKLLEHAENLGGISVPRAVQVTGSVLGLDPNGMEAEVVFTPHVNNALVAGISAPTRAVGGVQQYSAQLTPDTEYDVLVYPLGRNDSSRYPPQAWSLTTDGVDFAKNFPYPELVKVTGSIADEDRKPAPKGCTVKLRWRDKLLASSSIGTIGDAGAFEFWAPQTVLDAPADHELALDLSGCHTPQNVQIAFDFAAAPLDHKWVMPALPEPVPFIGTVEISALLTLPRADNAINAELTWVSSFEPPSEQVDVRNRDWCRLKYTPSRQNNFRCSALVTTAVKADLSVMVTLMPGDYEVFVAPSEKPSDAQRVKTQLFEENIYTQPTGVQEGRAFRLSPANQFKGCVLNSVQKVMPAVAVTATALGIEGGLGDVALYNRSDSQTSGRDGKFTLAVDVGWYDLLATPPDGSGYAWVLNQNRRIDGPATQGTKCVPVSPQLPVIARGQVIDERGAALSQATVDAYALVPNLAGGDERAVRIARAISDEKGNFALQMPPTIGRPDDEVPDGGVSDASLADAQR